jgi:hypothetical protein
MRIWIDPARSLIFIDGAAQSFMPQQLLAVADGDHIHIALADAAIDVAAAHWSAYRDHNNAAFAAMADVMAYLAQIFAQGITHQSIAAAITAADVAAASSLFNPLPFIEFALNPGL